VFFGHPEIVLLPCQTIGFVPLKLGSLLNDEEGSAGLAMPHDLPGSQQYTCLGSCDAASVKRLIPRVWWGFEMMYIPVAAHLPIFVNEHGGEFLFCL
jgi:hypothetical protein